jgi:CRP-like cAMP-binding protein
MLTDSFAAQALFRHVPTFARRGHEARAHDPIIAERCEWSGGQVLFRQNEAADGMYLVESGEIQLSTSLPGDGSVVLTTVGSHAVFGEMSLLDGGIRSASATVLSPSRGFFISRRRFEAIRTDLRPYAFDLMDGIGTLVAQRMRQMAHRIAAEPLTGIPRGPAPSASHGAPDWSATPARSAPAAARALPAFSDWPAADVEGLLARAEHVHLKRGHLLWVQGDPSEGLVVVLRGAVRCGVTRCGSLQQLAIQGPGTLVGAIGMMDGEPRAVHAEVREDAVLARIDNALFSELRSTCSDLSFRLLAQVNKGLAQSLRRWNRHLGRLCSLRRFNDREQRKDV